MAEDRHTRMSVLSVDGKGRLKKTLFQKLCEVVPHVKNAFLSTDSCQYAGKSRFKKPAAFIPPVGACDHADHAVMYCLCLLRGVDDQPFCQEVDC